MATSQDRQQALSQLSHRVEALSQAAELGAGRVDPDALDYAENILERTSHRRELSAEHTVIGFFLSLIHI